MQSTRSRPFLRSLRRSVPALAAGALAAACSASGGSDPEPPTGLSYPVGVTTIRIGVWAPALRPELERGLADRFSIEPALPPGLQLDVQTGEISGIPEAPYARETYVVSAFNPFGDTQAVIDLAVEAAFDRVRFAYVAGFTDHTVSMFTIDGATGQLVSNGYVPCDTGPADLATTPNGDQLYVTNLQSGRLSHYSVDSVTGRLTLRSHVVSGPGAVGVVVHPTKSVLYTVNSAGEALSSDDPSASATSFGSSVRAFRIDAATGSPSALGQPLPAGGPVALALHPRGELLYVANFAADTLGGYAVGASGELTALGDLPVGRGPVSVALHPSGDFLFLACSRSDELMLFELDAEGTPLLLQSLPTADGPIDVTTNADGDSVIVSQSGAGELGFYTFDVVSRSLVFERSEVTPSKPFQVTLDPLGGQLYTTYLDTGEVSIHNRDVGDFVMDARQLTRGAASGIALVSGATAQRRSSPVTWAASGLHEVETLDVEASGQLTDRARPLPAGETPDRLTLHPFGHVLYVLASGSDDVSSYAVDPTDYGLTPLGTPVFVGRDAGDFIVEPRGMWAYASAEGGIQGFVLQPSGEPQAAEFVTAGVRLDDLAMHPGGRFVYALDRGADAILQFDINPLTCQLRSSSSGRFALADAANAGALLLHPSGRYLYVTNGGQDTLTRFRVAPKTGVLEDALEVSTGAGPGALGIHPTGRLLLVAHAGSGNLFALEVDSLGTAPGLIDAITVGRDPAAVVFGASGNNAYVANEGSDSISVLDLGWSPDAPGSFALDVDATLTLPVGAAPRGLLVPWIWSAQEPE